MPTFTFLAGILCTTVLYLCASTTVVSSEKILFLLPITTKSQKNVFDPLYKALADRGHQITIVSPANLSTPYPNIRELVPLTYAQLFGTGSFLDPFARRRRGKLGNVFASFNLEFGVSACDVIYRNQEFMSLLREPNSFDLVFISIFVSHCFLGFIHKLGSPFISVTTVAAPNMISHAVGNHLPPSFVPFVALEFTQDMNFLQRVGNFLVNLYSMDERHTKPFEDSYKKHLGTADMPDLDTLEKNVSMIFSNSYFPLNYPRPLLPDIVEVGGMHCRPGEPLPKELEEFLAGAEHGFIYFSMGSVVNTDHMAEEVRLKFLNVFSRLKQRVIWKWNSGEMDGLPENVMVSKWLPQQDILGHQNIRIFITHGGLLSTQEAAYHGVPLLGIPVILDQDLNMKQAENSGYALKLEILDFTEDILEELLHQLLNDAKYLAKAQELSSIIKDQLQTPLERAVFWSEYVMRHKGSQHLRSAARKLNFVQYHSLDVIAFLCAVLIIILWTVKVVVVKFMRIALSFSLSSLFPRKRVAGLLLGQIQTKKGL